MLSSVKPEQNLLMRTVNRTSGRTVLEAFPEGSRRQSLSLTVDGTRFLCPRKKHVQEILHPLSNNQTEPQKINSFNYHLFISLWRVFQMWLWVCQKENFNKVVSIPFALYLYICLYIYVCVVAVCQSNADIQFRRSNFSTEMPLMQRGIESSVHFSVFRHHLLQPNQTNKHIFPSLAVCVCVI